MEDQRLRVAVHKFSSCDGCQLAFLNLGEDLLTLSQRLNIVFFAEAGMMNENTDVDIAFVEGSISTAKDAQRIRNIREHSRYLVTIGACATAGGLQALRNLADTQDWIQAIYTDPQHIDTLDKVSPIAEHVAVDFELWGCPINKRQLMGLINNVSLGVFPFEETDKLCMECKRQQQTCIMVTKDLPCFGPLTRTGCGALCPSFGRDCYGCYGPAENINTESLTRHFSGIGLLPQQISQRLLATYSQDKALGESGLEWKTKT